MNIRIIFILSLFGVLMGFLSINGYTQDREPWLWLIFTLISAWTIYKVVDYKIFLHGFFVGLLWGIINGLIQSLFFETYLTNNTSLQSDFNQITFMEPQYFVMATGPIIGIITGLVLGAASLIIRRFMRNT